MSDGWGIISPGCDRVIDVSTKSISDHCRFGVFVSDDDSKSMIICSFIWHDDKCEKLPVDRSSTFHREFYFAFFHAVFLGDHSSRIGKRELRQVQFEKREKGKVKEFMLSGTSPRSPPQGGEESPSPFRRELG